MRGFLQDIDIMDRQIRPKVNQANKDQLNQTVSELDKKDTADCFTMLPMLCLTKMIW